MIVERLQDEPGKWALVESGCSSASVRKAWQRLGCEATTRRIILEKDEDTGDITYSWDVYARWPEQDLAAVVPYIANRRARNVPREGL